MVAAGESLQHGLERVAGPRHSQGHCGQAGGYCSGGGGMRTGRRRQMSLEPAPLTGRMGVSLTAGRGGAGLKGGDEISPLRLPGREGRAAPEGVGPEL